MQEQLRKMQLYSYLAESNLASVIPVQRPNQFLPIT
jgi:hypothetical protein